MIQRVGVPVLNGYEGIRTECIALAKGLTGMYVDWLRLGSTDEGVTVQAGLTWRNCSSVVNIMAPLQEEPQPELNDLSRMALASMGEVSVNLGKSWSPDTAVYIHETAPARMAGTALRQSVVAACLDRTSNFGWLAGGNLPDLEGYFLPKESFILETAYDIYDFQGIVEFLAFLEQMTY